MRFTRKPRPALVPRWSVWQGLTRLIRITVATYWRWHLGPLVPGLATFGAMAMLDARAHHVHPWVAFFVNLFFVSVLVLAWKFNAYAARCLQKRIDELYTAEASE